MHEVWQNDCLLVLARDTRVNSASKGYPAARVTRYTRDICSTNRTHVARRQLLPINHVSYLALLHASDYLR